MAVFPYMQFQTYNPMDTAIRSAMQVYEGLGQGRQRRLQSEMLEKQIPYQEQLLQQQLQSGKLGIDEASMKLKYAPQLNEAQLALLAAQTSGQMSSIEKNRAILDIVRNQLSGGGSSGSQSGGGMSVGSPYGNSSFNEPYPGPSAQEVFANRFAGLPDMSPEQQAAVKRWEKRMELAQAREFENQYGTQSTINDIQKQQKGISTLMPAIDELIRSDTPGVLGFGGLPGEKNSYLNKVGNATEKLIASEGWGNNIETHHKAEAMLMRQDWETEAQYKKRLKDLKKSILETNTVLEDLKGNSSQKNHGMSVSDPDVIFTAKKYGITPEQVLQRLNGAR